MTDTIAEAPPVGTVHQIDPHRVHLIKQPTAPLEDVVLPAGVEAVDRPDNPLADWLSVPDAPLLPAWARSRASVVANAQALARLTWWHARFHAFRVPKYLVKTVLLAARGFFRATVGLWPTLSAHDHTATVRALRAQVKVKPEDVELAARLQAAHYARTPTPPASPSRPSSPTCSRSCGTHHRPARRSRQPRRGHLRRLERRAARWRAGDGRRQAREQAGEDRRCERRRVSAPRHRGRRPRRDPAPGVEGG
ncbi:MAG: cell division FtsK/SpoIIIE, partial [Streptosporangiaceae bacterium]|nr:cell division FtsK/SpoIIIE [Streptosporangiaceae bacterium]